MVDESITKAGGDDYSLIHRSDIATYGDRFYIWINGTRPVTWTVMGTVEPGTPKGSFPFARLASVTSQSVTYLYHQINRTTFAEELWDHSGEAWGTTEYIHVTEL